MENKIKTITYRISEGGCHESKHITNIRKGSYLWYQYGKGRDLDNEKDEYLGYHYELAYL